MIPAQQHSLTQQADTLYEQYGKPLEAEHRGKYVAIAPDGRTLIEASLPELMQKAKPTLGAGNFIFKIGDRSVGKWL